MAQAKARSHERHRRPKKAASERPAVIVADHWRIVKKGSGIVVYGFMDGHPDHEDGTEMFSSEITSVNGFDVITRSGHHYRLGKPAPWAKMAG